MVPLVKPLMVHVVADPLAVHVPIDAPPIAVLKAVATVLLIAAPLAFGAVQLTCTEPLPAA